MSAEATHDELIRRVKTLSERLWEGHCQAPDIEAWLCNFDGRHCGDTSGERLHALHLLASVSYFGLREIRVLLRSMFRDLYRYPIVQRLRDDLGGTTDAVEIEHRFNEELLATRFIGMGNPAESGTHLLYYFRQENRLPRSLFVHQHELLTSAATDPNVDFNPSNLKRIVFIDDLCGSGEQSVRYSRTLLRDLKDVAVRRGRDIAFHYLVLFGTSSGIARAERESSFDVVDAVSELDATYQTFGDDSRVFRRPPHAIEPATSKHLATEYGSELWPEWPLGFENGQLLLAFHHNVPDNSLPILWFDESDPSWVAAFPRHPKID
ncbi:MAG TPA: hypothetical protein VEW48_02620 [Thermoanaerobaculia bacterium]|nr:hypothetical protein [Thermoanaerobaculia bacterium]